VSGNTMTMTVPVTFKGALTPMMGTFLQALDVKGNWTGMTQFGNWAPPTFTARPGISIVNTASSTNAGSYAVYSVTAAHTSGSSAIAMITLLLGTRISDPNPCQPLYLPGANVLNLVNDSGSGLASPTGITPGTPGSIANSRCSINTGLASRVLSGSNVTVTIPLNLKPATFGGAKTVYVNAFDGFGELTHWVQGGTLNVQ